GISAGEGRSSNDRPVWTKGADDAPVSSRRDRWCNPYADGGNARDYTFRARSIGPGQARWQTSRLDDAPGERLSLHEPDAQPGAGKTTLASRRSIAKTPPSARECLLSGIDYGRDRRFRAQTMLESDGVLSRRQERFSMKIRGGLLDSRLGPTTGNLVPVDA